MNTKYVENVSRICEQLKHGIGNRYNLEMQLDTFVSYKCLGCDMFLKNGGKCLGKSTNSPCLYNTN